jgi:hypothetical protein
MRQPVKHRPADAHDERLAEIDRHASQRADRRPADDEAQADRENAGDDLKVRRALEGVQVRALVDGAAHEADLCQPQSDLVCSFAHG